MGKCRFCGCTDGKACVGGCHWVEKDVCSNCAISLTGLKEEISAYLNDPNTKEIIIEIIEKKGAKSRLKII